MQLRNGSKLLESRDQEIDMIKENQRRRNTKLYRDSGRRERLSDSVDPILFNSQFLNVRDPEDGISWGFVCFIICILKHNYMAIISKLGA